jgi:hypothetical protein
MNSVRSSGTHLGSIQASCFNAGLKSPKGKSMRFQRLILISAIIILPSCATQQVVRRPQNANTDAFASPQEMFAYLKSTETELGWRFFLGRESFDYEYNRKKGHFIGEWQRLRIVAPNLIAFRYFEPDLMFFIPGIPLSHDDYVAGISAFSITPSGERLAYTFVEGTVGKSTPIVYLYLWDAADKEPRLVRQLPADFPCGYATPLAISPDGQKLALLLPRESSGTALTVLDLKTRAERPVADDAYGELNWTADGNSIIYQALLKPKEKKVTIRSVDVETGISSNVATGLAPVLSPDGRRLAFVRFSMRPFLLAMLLGPTWMCDVVVRDIESGIEETVVRQSRAGWGRGTLASGNRLVWSPDGRFLHYGWFDFRMIASGFIVDTQSRQSVNLGENAAFAAWNRLSPKFEAHVTHDHQVLKSADELWKGVQREHQENAPARPTPASRYDRGGK